MADSSVRVVYGAATSAESLIVGAHAWHESAKALSALRALAGRTDEAHPVARLPAEILALIERATVKAGIRSARKQLGKLIGDHESIHARSVCALCSDRAESSSSALCRLSASPTSLNRRRAQTGTCSSIGSRVATASPRLRHASTAWPATASSSPYASTRRSRPSATFSGSTCAALTTTTATTSASSRVPPSGSARLSSARPRSCGIGAPSTCCGSSSLPSRWRDCL